MTNWIDLIDVDLPDYGPITQKTIEETQKGGSRSRGSVRVSMGKVWTDKEYEQRRNRVLNTPLS